MNAPPVDPLEAAILAGSIRALRRGAEAIRKRASVGVTVLDRQPAVVVIESKGAHLYRIARDLDQVAADLEAEEWP